MSDSKSDAPAPKTKQPEPAPAPSGLVPVYARHTIVYGSANGQQVTALPGDACEVPAEDLDRLLDRGAVTMEPVSAAAPRVGVTQDA